MGVTSPLINRCDETESLINRTNGKGKVLLFRHADRLTESKLAKGDVLNAAGGLGIFIIDEIDKDVSIAYKFPIAIVGKGMANKILSYINSTRYQGDHKDFCLKC